MFSQNKYKQIGLKIAFLNVGGLNVVKLEKLEKLIDLHNLDVVAFAETWCGDLPYILDGYKVVVVKPAAVRASNSRPSEGIAVIAKEDLKISVCENVSDFGVGIHVLDKVVVFLYIHPDDTNFSPIFNDSFLCVSSEVVIVGDVNMSDNSPEDDKFCDELSGLGVWKVKNDTPTFKRGAVTSRPDKVFTNFDIFPEYTDTGFTEHSLVNFEIYEKIVNPIPTGSYSLVKIKRKKEWINQKINKLLDEVPPEDNPDKEYNNLERILKEAFRVAKNTGKKGRNALPPLVVTLKKQKNKLRKNVSQNGLLLDIIRRLLKKLFRDLKNANAVTPEASSDPEKQLKVILDAGRERDSGGITSSKKCEEILDSFLVSGDEYSVDSVLPRSDGINYLDEVTTNEVSGFIKRFSNGKAAGCSGIKNELLKEGEAIHPRIAALFNNIFRTQKIPERWKLLKFFPLRKDNKNFRPIALTEVFRKLFERVLLFRMDVRVSDQQAGFVKGRNTVDQAVLFDNYLKRSNGELKVVALDISKAYDSVDRRILYRKLIKKGLNSQLVRIIVGLSEGVKCHVESGGFSSSERVLTRGLPQGSVISPVLFNLFIDDIVLRLHPAERYKMLLYADDILLFCYSKQSLQKYLNKVEAHSLENNYRFNPKKCLYMSSQSLDIMLYGQPLARSSCLKYLGFYFNCKGFDNLKTVGIARRAAVYKAVVVRKGILKLYGRKCNPGLYLNLYKSYIRPTLDYSIGVGVHRKVLMEKMEILQRKVIKYFFGWPRRTPTSLIYALLPLEEVKIRAEIIALNIFKRLSVSRNKLIKNLVLKENTSLFSKLREIEEYYRNEEINILKKNLFLDARVSSLGTGNASFKIKKIKSNVWWDSIDTLLTVCSDEELFLTRFEDFKNNFKHLFSK